MVPALTPGRRLLLLAALMLHLVALWIARQPLSSTGRAALPLPRPGLTRHRRAAGADPSPALLWGLATGPRYHLPRHAA
jgi:hypothetical protein